MNPEFSLVYREKRFRFRAENGAIRELEPGISVESKVREFPEFGAVEWALSFCNESDHDSGILKEIRDCDALLPLELPEPPKRGFLPGPGHACVAAVRGSVDGNLYSRSDSLSSLEFGVSREYLDKAPERTVRFQNTGARSSDGTAPFFKVSGGSRGYVAAVGWTGAWQAEFQKEEGGVRMRSGLQEIRLFLKPGETIRTSSVLIMSYGPDEDPTNKFRRLIREHFSHKSRNPSQRDGLMAFELWGGLTSEMMKTRIEELRAHGIRFEDVWIDAGWYGNCTECDDPFTGDWGLHTGEWEVNPRIHPDGLRDVAECAKNAGMRLMLWLEPERAIKTTRIVKEHPDWFLTLPDGEPGADNAILYYGNPEAKKYVFSLVCRYAEELGLSCYRQDFNTSLTPYFRAADPEGRRGITEIRHITGMYELWDALLKKYPGLLIDNCSSGGRRIDVETLRRSIPFFRSDYQCNFNENSEVLQTHNAGISGYLPFSGCTTKTKGDLYAVRSSYSSSWGGAFYNAVFQSMDEEDFSWAKAVTEEYRSIRRYFSCDFYNHGSRVFDDTSWAIWQYHDPDAAGGIVMAFRRGASPFDRASVSLRGVAENAVLLLRNLNDGTETESGTDLEIRLPDRRSSVILEYREIPSETPRDA